MDSKDKKLPDLLADAFKEHPEYAKSLGQGFLLYHFFRLFNDLVDVVKDAWNLLAGSDAANWVRGFAKREASNVVAHVTKNLAFAGILIMIGTLIERIGHFTGGGEIVGGVGLFLVAAIVVEIRWAKHQNRKPSKKTIVWSVVIAVLIAIVMYFSSFIAARSGLRAVDIAQQVIRGIGVGTRAVGVGLLTIWLIVLTIKAELVRQAIRLTNGAIKGAVNTIHSAIPAIATDSRYKAGDLVSDQEIEKVFRGLLTLNIWLLAIGVYTLKFPVGNSLIALVILLASCTGIFFASWRDGKDNLRWAVRFLVVCLVTTMGWHGYQSVMANNLKNTVAYNIFPGMVRRFEAWKMRKLTATEVDIRLQEAEHRKKLAHDLYRAGYPAGTEVDLEGYLKIKSVNPNPPTPPPASRPTPTATSSPPPTTATAPTARAAGTVRQAPPAPRGNPLLLRQAAQQLGM